MSKPAAPSDRLVRLFLIGAIVLGGELGCRHGETIAATTERHPNGLSVTLPMTLDVPGLGPQRVSVEPTQNGFAVAVAREHVLRYAIGATVDLHTEAAAARGAWPQERTVRGRSIRYAIDEDDAGMGGKQYTLNAWTPCKSGYVLWRQSDIDQSGPPPFDLLWTLVEGTGGC